MTITIYDHEVRELTHDRYDVTFFNDEIKTPVTDTPSFVTDWISDIENIHGHRLHHLVVGLDVELRPSFTKFYENPVATLQLCVGHRCLIFKILQSPYIPNSLENFLGNPNYTFVGVGIDNDVEKLAANYNLGVAKTADLRSLAAEAYDRRDLNNFGLKGLGRFVLGKEVNKPKSITLSRWDEQWLTPDQVLYACVDAFLSFEIGRILI